jgi:hypothetical protein
LDVSASRDVKKKKLRRKREKARRGDGEDWKGGMAKGKDRNKGIKGRNAERRKEEKEEVQIFT